LCVQGGALQVDTTHVDLQTHPALSLCPGEIRHTQKQKKKVKLKNSLGANGKLLESSRALHGVVTLSQCPFSLLFPKQKSRKKGVACLAVS